MTQWGNKIHYWSFQSKFKRLFKNCWLKCSYSGICGITSINKKHINPVGNLTHVSHEHGKLCSVHEVTERRSCIIGVSAHPQSSSAGVGVFTPVCEEKCLTHYSDIWTSLYCPGLWVCFGDDRPGSRLYFPWKCFVFYLPFLLKCLDAAVTDKVNRNILG